MSDSRRGYRRIKEGLLQLYPNVYGSEHATRNTQHALRFPRILHFSYKFILNHLQLAFIMRGVSSLNFSSSFLQTGEPNANYTR
jgi:hypothetical protein